MEGDMFQFDGVTYDTQQDVRARLHALSTYLSYPGACIV